MQSLSSCQPQVIEDVDGNLLLLALNIRIGFFSYGYPLLEKPNLAEGVALAATIGIGF